MNDEMKRYQSEAIARKDYAINTLGKNAPIPHDLWRRIVPIAREFNRSNSDIVTLYTYLLASVNGQRDNDRYMSAFKSVQRIADDTGIGRNRIAHLSDVLEACGLLRTYYDYKSNKRDKLYYPLYYSALTDNEIRANMRTLEGQSLQSELPKSP